MCQEVFGPTVSIQGYDDIETVFAEVSAHRFGLQCGLLTKSRPPAIRASAVSIRDGRRGSRRTGTSTWWTDQLPYGGIRGKAGSAGKAHDTPISAK